MHVPLLSVILVGEPRVDIHIFVTCLMIRIMISQIHCITNLVNMHRKMPI